MVNVNSVSQSIMHRHLRFQKADCQNVTFVQSVYTDLRRERGHFRNQTFVS